KVDSYIYYLNIFSEIHNVFHVNLLHLTADDSLSSQVHHESQSSVIDIDEHDKYYVEKILNEKIRYHQKYYLIK
ncbi:hypothetical protein ACJ72_07923, partial [Emergomyces africanus]